MLTLDSTTTGSYSWVKTGSTGPVSADYLNIQHCVASPGHLWYAGTHSVDNNSVATAGSGWVFTAVPTSGVKAVGPTARASIKAIGPTVLADIWTVGALG